VGVVVGRGGGEFLGEAFCLRGFIVELLLEEAYLRRE
jgi:hypothetical protein